MTTTAPLAGLEDRIDALRDVGRYFFERSWSLGTSSNYSVVLGRDPLELLVTASGKDKGRLGREDFVRVNSCGKPIVDGQPKSSAETLLHVVVAKQRPEVGAVLHTHSVWSTLLSDLYFAEGGVPIEGYEMLKGLAGVTTHEHALRVPIFDNTQDMPSLAKQVMARMSRGDDDSRHAFLIRRHGLYTWGVDLEEARRHVEILEFLFECVARRPILAREAVVHETT